ncbi:uncharacterized protein LOC8276010 [Ricinus communis]|uniref:uncharacterized protein LOC8276010 n=1 Tax=Ricinus communis TaxID=3988 RepID=UPI00077224F7|nr:uncharacterized protein LOC8276010 [Ricinus communis]XP_015573720.1 uncharacterized protein LOC8276010 [Ricinus communis]XP_048230764.1 uncharacterized protein LOC8276010 [Ricinus communis]XP_048230765.1 uncharacterized protein LOC8276010 [Ricinus communis]|eukprot:XP_015573719.1 uncharacterized protein LOC8276010 isoform X1 [Ricinus communis]
MEALYAKLYNKYDALKKKRISELDEISKDQEVNFLNYVSAAEELIQHLKNENNSLSAQVSELRSKVASISSTKDEECARYQKQLMEESQKNKVLYEEVERLQKLQEQFSFSSKHGTDDNKQLKMLQIAHVTSGEVISESTRRMTIKRSREASAEKEGFITPDRSNQDDLLVRESAKDPSAVRRRSGEAGVESDDFISPDQSNRDDVSLRVSANDPSRLTVSSGDLGNEQEPACCGRTVGRSGGGGFVTDNGSTNCQFQALIECLLGMKLSTANQTEEICVSALHQSSGYSFSLTWVKKAAGQEPELLYRPSTLGTFERVAPEWMRSVIKFSTSMCPIFFERVASVIKMHC